MLAYDVLTPRSSDAIEGNAVRIGRDMTHDLEDTRPALQPNKMTNPENVCHAAPAALWNSFFAFSQPVNHPLRVEQDHERAEHDGDGDREHRANHSQRLS